MARDGAKLLAVLIDADNVLAKHAEAILKEISTIGEPALRRVYGDWSSQQLAGWKTQARDLGLTDDDLAECDLVVEAGSALPMDAAFTVRGPTAVAGICST